MRKPKIFVRDFDRPNIYLRVDRFETEAEKRDALPHRTGWADKPGIVYVGTRKEAKEFMQALDEEGIRSGFHHGGLGRKEREETQERFMSGDAAVIVATNAFGIGVDKADVRFVYHNEPSESRDAYYQEIGRAGVTVKRPRQCSKPDALDRSGRPRP
jgi:ATP-dependent DNA helicase RecQ